MQDARKIDTDERFADHVAHAAHLLPAQGPIGEFIHHNTLHAYQHLPFDDALRAAARDHGAEVYWSERKFREAFEDGYFGRVDVDAALVAVRGHEDVTGTPLGRRTIERLALIHDFDALLAEKLDDATPDSPLMLAALDVTRGLILRPPAPPRPLTHREALVRLGSPDPAADVDAVLIPFLSAFLDDGMARWPMPGREQGLYASFVRYARATRRLAPPFVVTATRGLVDGADVERLGSEALDAFGVSAADRAAYVERSLLELPGFSGMVAVLGTRGHPYVTPESLVELLAIRLVLMHARVRELVLESGYGGPLGALVDHAHEASLPGPLGHREIAARLALLARHGELGPADLELAPAESIAAMLDHLLAFDSIERRKVFLRALESAHARTLVAAVAANRERPTQRESPSPRFQVMFCIDDREEGIRRHFEELDPRHVTFGVAGFFGIAMRYQSLDDPRSRSLCPIVVTPAHTVIEQPLEDEGANARFRAFVRRAVGWLELEARDASHSVLRGLFVTPLLGLLAVVPLAGRVLFPRRAELVAAWFREHMLPVVRTELVVERDERDEGTHGEHGEPHVGFTLAERTALVASTLENVGLVTGFAPLVALLGHGASTVNNPHHSAYDCGACGGSNGGPNARAFARMANDPAVRAALLERSIRIPESTWFVGGWHDTTTDRVTLFDVETVPDGLADEHRALRAALDVARARSAHERCRRFEHAPRYLAPEVALRHVEERAVDLSQARPELGHATNAACIVGRRALSRGLFLDRRAFLVSYDPARDDDGALLERILAAVVPVGAGINLEYYFSSVDPDRFGCGTKLPHNLSGLVGVMEGATGDLRTGLPREMTEVHEPVRLLCIVEAPVARVLAVAERVPVIRELVVNEWIRLVVVDPDTGAIEAFARGAFHPLELLAGRTLATVHTASDWYRGRLHSLPPARITPVANLLDDPRYVEPHGNQRQSPRGRP